MDAPSKEHLPANGVDYASCAMKKRRWHCTTYSIVAVYVALAGIAVV